MSGSRQRARRGEGSKSIAADSSGVGKQESRQAEFVRIALPSKKVTGTRVTPFLASMTAEIVGSLERLRSIQVEAVLFVAEGPRSPSGFAEPLRVQPATLLSGVLMRLASGGTLAGSDGPETPEHQLLAATLLSLVDAGPGAMASLPFGDQSLTLHVLEKGATPSDYRRLSVPGGRVGEGAAMPRPSISAEFDQAIGRKLPELPSEFEARRTTLRALHTAVREATASAFEPVLNTRAQAMPHESYEDKKALAKWVNAELRELGLTLRCPKTGAPALLHGHPGGTPGVGRFHLEVTDDRGVRRRTVTSARLPHLVVRPDDLSRAPYGERSGRGR